MAKLQARIVPMTSSAKWRRSIDFFEILLAGALSPNHDLSFKCKMVKNQFVVTELCVAEKSVTNGRTDRRSDGRTNERTTVNFTPISNLTRFAGSAFGLALTRFTRSQASWVNISAHINDRDSCIAPCKSVYQPGRRVRRLSRVPFSTHWTPAEWNQLTSNLTYRAVCLWTLWWHTWCSHPCQLQDDSRFQHDLISILRC